MTEETQAARQRTGKPAQPGWRAGVASQLAQMLGGRLRSVPKCGADQF